MEHTPHSRTRADADSGGPLHAASLDKHNFAQATMLMQQGHLQEAQAIYQDLLQKHPDNFECTRRLGWIALQNGDYARAVDYGCRAIEIDPQSAPAHIDLGAAMYNLGHYEASLECLDLAIARDDTAAQAHNNRALALKALGKTEAALASVQKALALDADQAQAWLNLGTLQRQLDQHEDALASYDRALALQPTYAQAHLNRGNVLQDLGRLEAALAQFDRALALEPGIAQANWNKAIALLLGGNYSAAWPLYEWRWVNHQPSAPTRHERLPVWDGSAPLAGKTLLVQSEQGLGDTIQFCRYIRLLAAQGAHVVFEVDPALVKVMEAVEGVSQVALKSAPGQAPTIAADYQVLLMSLPLCFKTTVDTIPAPAKYLKAAPEHLNRWRQRLGHRRGKRIGLVWRGNPQHQNDAKRSIPLDQLLACLPPEFEYVSLQFRPNVQEQQALAAHGVLQTGDEVSDFADTAAICEQLDLVISVDTSVAHLSGALGVPCWVLLVFSPDWRWLLQRKDCVWYPKTRVYRQPQPGRWDVVMQEVTHDLLRPTASAAGL